MTDDPTEDEQNEERGDIAMALRDYGVADDIVDEVDGQIIEDARATFFEVVGVDWNWAAQQDKWAAQAMSLNPTAYPTPEEPEPYDPLGTKHRYYEEN